MTKKTNDKDSGSTRILLHTENYWGTDRQMDRYWEAGDHGQTNHWQNQSRNIGDKAGQKAKSLGTKAKPNGC